MKYYIDIPKHASIMFVKCNTQSENIYNIPDAVAGIINIPTNSNIKLKCVKSDDSSKISLSEISRFYSMSTEITVCDFYKSQEKFIIFTVDLLITEMVNLEYILVMNEFFKKNNIKYYLIINTDGCTDTYFKLYHYFNVKYEPLYDNVFIRTADKTISKLPSNDIDYSPGEIIPYFNIDFDFYQCCYCLFEFDASFFDEYKNSNTTKKKKDIYKQYHKKSSDIEFYLSNYIYSRIDKNTNSLKIIKFLEEHPSTPILAMVLFMAIISKDDLIDYNSIYENCLDYSLSLEQLIENSFFYAGNGILSIRIHRSGSIAMSDICNKTDFCGFLVEITLIDFQENIQNRSIISQFVTLADANDEEKLAMKEVLSGDHGLNNLFQFNGDNAVTNYFAKPNIIIKHYGLQTIGILAQKTNSLLCVRSCDSFYSNHENDLDGNSNYKKQNPYMYKYKSGIYYKLIIPVVREQKNDTYIGFSSNRYAPDEVKYDYHYFEGIKQNTNVPITRKEKTDNVDIIKKAILSAYTSGQILVVDASIINSRIQLEYLIKAILAAFHTRKKDCSSIKIAIINIKNKTLFKLALRFIAICYNRYEENVIFKNNELFLCTEDCKTDILISGKDYDQIISNISAQRIFGAIDEDLFEEIKLSLKENR